MTKSLVVGQTNAGKTCFTVNFADYLGVEKLKLTLKQPAGFSSERTYQLQTAREELVASQAHTTKQVQQIELQLPAKKGSKKLELVDTCGLIEGIHSQYQIRTAMAQTLAQLRQADIILHIVDLIKLDTIKQLPRLDLEIYNYCRDKCYLLLANKIDLEGAANNLTYLQQKLSSKQIIPISALYQRGFKKVKSFLLKNI
ncbi:MAG: GTPase domain-containing protein [Bacillota bacterium]